MLISPPFLPARQTNETEDAWIERSMAGAEPGDGAFPVSYALGWHGGMHLIAPPNGTQSEPVRAIADGTVVFKRDPTPQPGGPLPPEHPQAYRGGWTDNGVVVIQHITEIGDGTDAQATFFSVYMHLRNIDPAIAANRAVFRKANLGEAGQVYGALERRIHFEVICDDTNLRRLVGRAIGELNTAADGRTDAVYGELYFHLPEGTPFFAQRPPLNEPAPATAPAHTLRGAPLIIGVRYAAGDGPEGQRGHAFVSTYRPDGTRLDGGNAQAAELIEADGEYNLYRSANDISNAYPDNASPAPSAVYELLRFGRVINTAEETLTPANVPHWRLARYDGGQGWVNLNARGVRKFSDADFPHWKRWALIDDSTDQDSRCDSATIRGWLDLNANQDVSAAEAQQAMSTEGVRDKLARTICKFPTEWDAGSFDARWGWLKQSTAANPSPSNEESFGRMRRHLEALAFWPGGTGLETSHWHFQPREFVRQLRRCGWLSLSELMRAVPGATEQNASRFRRAINAVQTKYMDAGRVRHSHFLGQVAHETSSLAGPMVERGNSAASRAYETDDMFFAGPDTYSYFRIAQGYERLNNTLGNQYNSGDGIKFRGRGSLQVTGRAHYATYWVYRGWLGRSDFQASWWSQAGWWQSPPNPAIQPAIINNPQRVSARVQGNEFNPIDVGGWFWTSNRINCHCDPENRGVATATTANAVSQVINRYDEPTFPARRALVERAKQVLGDAT
jgi:predicted chitinase